MKQIELFQSQSREIDLHHYDIIIINSSAGKDSLCAIYEICRLAREQDYPKDRIHISHQDLKESEWSGTKELAEKQAKHFGLHFHIVTRTNQHGQEETILQYAERRGKWPSSKQRWCTSDFKRGPGAKVVTRLTRGKKINVLYVFGFRKDESPARDKKKVLTPNPRLSTKSRKVDEFLPIHHWTVKQVWQTIKDNALPYHPAYDLGMPRLSCVFCIFSPFDALVIAGKANPKLLEKYVQVEEKIGHSFKQDVSLAQVQKAINEGYSPKKKLSDWIM